MSARSVPEELVEAAAEALRTYFAHEGRPHALTRSEAKGAATSALQAAFAKLSECEAAVQAGAAALYPPECRSLGVPDARSVLAALAREFETEEASRG